MDDPSDEELLEATARDPQAFGRFYRRHRAAVVGHFMVRTRDAELAADLTAEVFAAALIGSERYDRERASPRTWLYAIARNKLSDSLRRRQVEDAARRSLGMRPIALDDDDLRAIEEDARDATDLLEELPAPTREALTGHVIDERGYAELAAQMRCSESVVRKRVSRGLAALRTRLEERGA
jgi:RNA polymerase sigma factor (sigma-70 family)